MGSVEVTPFVSRQGRGSELMILKARKSGKAPFRLLPQVVLHESPKHTADQDDYTQQLTGILREGRALW